MNDHDDEVADDEEDEDGDGCEFCYGMEDVLVEAAREYKTKGWDPNGEGGGYCYGFTTSCEMCGRWFDSDEADQVYEETPGPAPGSGDRRDEIRRLAAGLGLDAAGADELIDLFQRRPMRG